MPIVTSVAPRFNGIIAVDKPRGWTSHDVVARVRRLAGQRQVGHGGTLDPMATGLLILGLGQGTRLLEYVSAGRKRYDATVRFGAETDTYDSEGSVVREAGWQQITEQLLDDLLSHFTGPIQQRPPLYSALKRAGEPLYRLARRGEQVEIEPRAITIYSMEIRRVALPVFEISVECSSGTYIRSLAHDLGVAAGSAAHLTSLRRTVVGALTLEDAVTLDALSDGGEDAVEQSLLALDRPVWWLPAVIVAKLHAEDITQGRVISAEPSGTELCRAYGDDGTFLALLRYDAAGSFWHPQKVFAANRALPAEIQQDLQGGQRGSILCQMPGQTRDEAAQADHDEKRQACRPGQVPGLRHDDEQDRC